MITGAQEKYLVSIDKNGNLKIDENQLELMGLIENEFNWNNMFLHAGELSIKQPNNGEQLLFKSSFPDDWDQLFKNFNWPKPK